MDEILDEKTYETRKVKPADFVSRTAAFLADILIFFMFSYGLNYALALSASYLSFLQQYWWQTLFAVIVYFTYFDGSESNATLGKQIMNIRLLTEEKRDVDYLTSTKHFLLSIVLFFGYFNLFTNESKQTLADKLCKVIVVKVR
jgi:uncharacterized RDD family membrane protein YckC